MSETPNLAPTAEQLAALPQARVFESAGDLPADRAFGRWHVLPDRTVIYERSPGVFEVAQILTAATLESSPTWRQVTA